MSGSQQLILGVGAGGAAPTYIEDVFSTWLYTGNNSTQTITNGIDLSTKGGMVWWKRRDNNFSHGVADTNRGTNKYIRTDTTDAEGTYPYLNSFNTNGYTLSSGDQSSNAAGGTYASWTFRKQPKFFDVVTYTGDGNYSTDTPAPYGRAIAHSLASRPGFVVIKATSTTSEWYVAARQDDTYWIGSNGSGTNAFRLNGTGAGSQNLWSTQPMADASVFYPARIGAGGSSGTTNDNGVTYVAYLFAHNAGGFGLTGTDNVISCGSFTTDGSGNATVSLGYEPQWCMFKRSSAIGNWTILDNMRGWVVGGNDNQLQANSSGAETSASNFSDPNATGFSVAGISASSTFVYIAIRRGPMKTPTSGTSVYQGITYTGNGAASRTFSPGITVDMTLVADRANPDDFGGSKALLSRLTGNGSLSTFNTNAQETTPTFTTNVNGTVTLGSLGSDPYGNRFWNSTYDLSYINYLFSRAPGFFDVVCYTGTGANRTVNHNLGVVPELMIVKVRNSSSYGWAVYSATLANTEYLRLDDNGTKRTSTTFWNSTTPTATVFSLGTSADTNVSGSNFVAYLFASCPGVSKVGSYTGTGALQTINCGFTSGARFVLIKRTDTAGNWWVYDSARGITSGNDPYLFLNDTAAEVAGTNYVDTTSVGFQVTAAAPTGLNASGGTYLFLAIA